MLMLLHVEQSCNDKKQSVGNAPISWTMNGLALVIKDREILVKHLLPKFFPHGKFQSFTRKLYRWEFRKVLLPRMEGDLLHPKDQEEIVFAHPFFQKNQQDLMRFMRSVTAAGRKRKETIQSNADEAQVPLGGIDSKSTADPSIARSEPAETAVVSGAAPVGLLSPDYSFGIPLSLPPTLSQVNPSLALAFLSQQQAQPPPPNLALAYGSVLFPIQQLQQLAFVQNIPPYLQTSPFQANALSHASFQPQSASGISATRSQPQTERDNPLQRLQLLLDAGRQSGSNGSSKDKQT